MIHTSSVLSTLDQSQAPYRVLARISKLPVQNSNFKISACPDLPTNLLQILIPTTFNGLLCQKGQLTLQLGPRIWLFGKYLVITLQKSKLKILHRKFCLSQKGGLQETACPKDGKDGSWLSPWLPIISIHSLIV